MVCHGRFPLRVTAEHLRTEKTFTTIQADGGCFTHLALPLKSGRRWLLCSGLKSWTSCGKTASLAILNPVSSTVAFTRFCSYTRNIFLKDRTRSSCLGKLVGETNLAGSPQSDNDPEAISWSFQAHPSFCTWGNNLKMEDQRLNYTSDSLEEVWAGFPLRNASDWKWNPLQQIWRQIVKVTTVMSFTAPKKIAGVGDTSQYFKYLARVTIWQVKSFKYSFL